MTVSVICPTYNRPECHVNLYAAFLHQTYENRELLILDDSPERSPFFSQLKDSRVKYFYDSIRRTIGQKRNLLAKEAQGDFIAHFDDDDYYAPTYLERVLDLAEKADFVKFSSWYIWREKDGSLWKWDTRLLSPTHYVVSVSGCQSIMVNNAQSAENRAKYFDATQWGFGFTYVYRKSLWLQCPFEDKNSGEDYNFACRLRELNCKAVLADNLAHLAMQVIHQKSTTTTYPQYSLNVQEAPIILGSEVMPWLRVRQ